MLQRAASNACSWWWASHIRTKQSKWLEQSLQDMEEKVQSMLKLIEEEGDSFAKRAEMYYKRRPELINAVEEAYRSFRSLADRYDMVSKELQNANHTIATVFPEQVQFSMDEEDDCTLAPKLPKINNPQIQNTTAPANIPKIPKAPMDDLKSLISTATKKFKGKKSTKPQKTKVKPVAKSGLTKDEAFREIDKLQKEILTLQTVKEFVKSSYESGVAKYWDIENQITEVQDKICKLQDEYDVDTFIEDNEARTLMAEAALKSCQETLSRLQEKQEKSSGEAREEQRKIEEARQLLKSLKIEFLKTNGEDYDGDEVKSEASDLVQQSKDNERSETKLDLGSLSGSLTVSELAEKIDELVNKVVSLESAISPQTVLIDTLRTETDDLHAQIRKLKNEKESLSCGQHDLREKLREMEEKLNELMAMNKNVESQNKNLQTDFAQARLSLDHLSEKLSTVKPDEDIDEVDCNGKSSNDHRKDTLKSEKEPIDVKEVDLSDIPISEIKLEEKIKKTNKRTVSFLDGKPKEEVSSVDSVKTEAGGESLKEEELNLQKLLLNGSEDREKILLKEYTAILRNYKDVKKKLNDTEKKEQDIQFDATVQMRELKKTILKRDQEIQTLRERLNALQGNTAENEDANVISDSDTALKLNSGSDPLDMNEIKLDLVANQSLSPVEQKLRTEIDSILDENLDFWLRFSTAFHQVQKFKSEVQDLQDEISNLKDKKKQEGSVTNQMRSEVRPIYKHLREIETELTVWLEQSDSLKDELKGRFASLCEIQEEIVRALKEGVEEDDILFSSHQAAKLQGEILNMKQENNKVREELQAGLDHAIVLQVEITKTLSKLNEEFGIATDNQLQLQKATSRPKVPLRSFIFGTKPRKQKQSIFSFIQPNRMYQAVRAGVPLAGQ